MRSFPINSVGQFAGPPPAPDEDAATAELYRLLIELRDAKELSLDWLREWDAKLLPLLREEEIDVLYGRRSVDEMPLRKHEARHRQVNLGTILVNRQLALRKTV